ncbi:MULTISPECIES: sugar phosphate isomerase/epimerase [unclassified Pseudomonas]|uniref:sugar phosphate isomerase/epimerase family protein n=1 Tax=unclassified Pseudomonas TaxID=196821 RepID=UPI000BCF09E7|nr:MULTISPECIES: TIM barrel protein [unclassified Pseudomonas]PVZ16469.1 sugar phosphate isomerase/epimerase [Pseudomonas sp. URIL14HWK12:I12]PVZ25675.1 sugar phosphate isomerase/epimerase [Pseudomonas sp. URIL14HWK12:I10]PVZ36801.1 sugar phosphate isomerase/epimerase [Pseudomonas sp. URIL14HWK12:I11]SNZ12586.1 Sugar phosphate isomerase/epimerase [Pseudomonas sp. URIL14HWK12:I9]
MKRLGVAHLTALELPPLELARQAARAGFDAVGLRLHPAVPGGLAYPLRPASAAFGQLRQVLDGEGVVVSDIEFIALTPEVDLTDLPWMLETGALLGARSLTVSGDDPDGGRLASRFASVCELAAPLGMVVNLEFMRWRVVGNLGQALAVVEAAGQGNGGILVDALHLFRAGNTVEELARVPARWLHDVQLCDAPAKAPPEEAIIQEAREGRLPPGEGGLPLRALLQVLPAQVRLSAEVPQPGLGGGERLAQAAQRTRALLNGYSL